MLEHSENITPRHSAHEQAIFDEQLRQQKAREKITRKVVKRRPSGEFSGRLKIEESGAQPREDAIEEGYATEPTRETTVTENPIPETKTENIEPAEVIKPQKRERVEKNNELLAEEKKELRRILLLTESELIEIPDDRVHATLKMVQRAKKVLTPNEFYTEINSNNYLDELSKNIIEKDPANLTTPEKNSPVLLADPDKMQIEARAFGLTDQQIDEVKSSGSHLLGRVYEQADKILFEARSLPENKWTSAMRSSEPIAALKKALDEHAQSGKELTENSDRPGKNSKVNNSKTHGSGKKSDFRIPSDIDQAVADRSASVSGYRDLEQDAREFYSRQIAKKANSQQVVEPNPDAVAPSAPEIIPAKVEIEEKIPSKNYAHPNLDPAFRALRNNPDTTEEDWGKFVAEDPERAAKYEYLAPPRISDLLNRLRIQHAHKAEVAEPISVQLAELESKLKQDHKIRFVPNHKLSPQQNLDNAKNIWEFAGQLSALAHAGINVKPSNRNFERPNDPHNTVEYDSTASPEDILGFLNGILVKRTGNSIRVPEAAPAVDASAAVEVPPAIAALKEKLDAAREKMTKLEAELGDVGGKKLFVADKLRSFAPDTKRTVKEFSLITAREAYNELRAEYVGANVENHLAERMQLIDNRLRDFAQRKRPDWENGPRKLVDWWKKQSAVTRIGTSLGLLGVSFALPAVAGGALFARKLISGSTSATGAYDMMNLARDRGSKKWSQVRAATLTDSGDIENHLAAIEARALFEGKTFESLKEDKIYTDLYEKFESTRETEHVARTAEKPENEIIDYFKKATEEENSKLSKKITKEELIRHGNKALAVIAGGLIGSGYIGKSINSMFHHDTQTDLSKGIKIHKGINLPAEDGSVAGSESAVEAGAAAARGVSAETATIQSVKIGSRGIEGSLIDLRDKNPKMMEWLRQQYQGSKLDDKTLIHKWVSEHAVKGENMDRILNGEIGIGANGDIHLDADKINFNHSAVRDIASTGHVAADKSSFHPKIKVSFDPNHHPVKNKFGVSFRPSVNTDMAANELSGGEVSDVDLNDYAVREADLEELKNHAPTMEQARYTAALSVEKLSDGLHLVLNEKYKNFVEKELHVSAKSLNKIKHLTYGQFLNSMNVSERFSKDFAGLAKFLADHKVPVESRLHAKLVELAVDWKQKT